MALTATIYNLSIDINDVDRGVYEKIKLRIARQPSETPEYMVMRVLAYCLEYGEGIALTEGVAAGDEPAIVLKDLTGKLTGWVEVGMPSAERLHRGHKRAQRAAVYTHRDAHKLMAQLSAGNVHRMSDIPVYAFASTFIDELSLLIERRSELSLLIMEKEIYVEIGGNRITTTIVEHRV